MFQAFLVLWSSKSKADVTEQRNLEFNSQCFLVFSLLYQHIYNCTCISHKLHKHAYTYDQIHMQMNVHIFIYCKCTCMFAHKHRPQACTFTYTCVCTIAHVPVGVKIQRKTGWIEFQISLLSGIWFCWSRYMYIKWKRETSAFWWCINYYRWLHP